MPSSDRDPLLSSGGGRGADVSRDEPDAGDAGGAAAGAGGRPGDLLRSLPLPENGARGGTGLQGTGDYRGRLGDYRGGVSVTVAVPVYREQVATGGA